MSKNTTENDGLAQQRRSKLRSAFRPEIRVWRPEFGAHGVVRSKGYAITNHNRPRDPKKRGRTGSQTTTNVHKSQKKGCTAPITSPNSHNYVGM